MSLFGRLSRTSRAVGRFASDANAVEKSIRTGSAKPLAKRAAWKVGGRLAARILR